MLIPVDEALERVLAGAAPVGPETIPLAQAAYRILAAPLAARRTQPPFPASAMDGYAVRAADIERCPVRLALKGMAAAGRPFPGEVLAGEAVRIFTGAPVPEGADTIAIQENVVALSATVVEVREPAAAGRHIRARGLDFREGETILPAGRELDPAALSLAASANHAHLEVVSRPLVAIIATGDELLPPGASTGPGQIIASNGYGVAAIAERAGARVLDLGIAPDDLDAIAGRIGQAIDRRADIVVTLGGASVGDHDLVQAALARLGVGLDFWKIAMRPGKPLMFGRTGATRCIGLPGNPVASLVCSHLFLAPLVARLAGRSGSDAMAVDAVLGAAMPANDLRQDYVRARITRDASGITAHPFPVQDSSMLRVFSDAGGLIVRPPHATAAEAGDSCRVLLLR